MSSRDPAAGYTLLELLVALGLLGLVMVAAFQFYALNNRTYARGQIRAEVQQNARVALEGMVRELRLAGYDASGVVATLSDPFPLQEATSGQLTLVADVDDDGVLDRVTYRRQGTSLVRRHSTWNGSAFTAPASGELANAVGKLEFAYFDGTTPVNGQLTAPVTGTTLGEIRRVTISLATHETSGAEQATYTLTADVSLRN